MRYHVLHDRTTSGIPIPQRLLHVTPTWQRTTCIFQWSLEREFMYFPGKLVYLIVRASNQLAVNSLANFFNFCWWRIPFAMTSLPRTGLHHLNLTETNARKQITFEDNRSLNNFPSEGCQFNNQWPQLLIIIVPRFRESTGTLNLIRLSVRPSVRHKNFNLGNNFCTITGRALILGMRVLCDKTFQRLPCHDLDDDLWPTSRSNLLPSGGTTILWICLFPVYNRFRWHE